MKYLLFAGHDYYPSGGALDLKGEHKTLREALEAHNPNEFRYDGGWDNILNKETMETNRYFYKGNWVNTKSEYESLYNKL